MEIETAIQLPILDEEDAANLLDQIAEAAHNFEEGVTLVPYRDTHPYQHENEKYTPEVVSAALIRSKGVIARAAALLGMHRHGVARFVRRYEICQLAREVGLAHKLEDVEAALLDNAIEKNNVVAQIFALKNLGRKTQPAKEGGPMADGGWRDAHRQENINVNIEPQVLKIGDKEITF